MRASRWCPLACAGVFLWLFLCLPMQMGAWWYVYPREATAAAFIALGALPGPAARRWLPRAPGGGALRGRPRRRAPSSSRTTAPSRPAAEELYAVTRKIPHAPKLLYLVFDHAGSKRTTTPFIHLPAYVQAERGGWLSFHFAMWRASPIVYRDPKEPRAVLPPPVPLRWEWTPQVFDVRRHGAFFDWFLVRHRSAPDALFRADPTIERVDRVGTWWLYRRRSAEASGR